MDWNVGDAHFVGRCGTLDGFAKVEGLFSVSGLD